MAISSFLASAANNIVRTNRSTSGMNKGKTSFGNFLRFMDVQTKNLESLKFNEKKLKKALSANVTTSFGNTGNLLSGLASGALDAASFVGDFFGRNKKVSPKAGKPIPKGPRIKFGGIRALGIANAVFAGLDFATGLAEGESVGKAAAGAGGALAGSLLGGVIGQSLIPIPGVGFMVGSALGGMAGGWLGDRAYETGEGIAKQKTESRLKQEEAKQRAQAEAATKITIADVMTKFDSVVYSFEDLVRRGYFGASSIESDGYETGDEDEMTEGELPSSGNSNPNSGTLGDYEVSGGTLPSSKRYSLFGPRGGRNHNGIDYSVSAGTPISVVQPGTVAVASNIDPRGWGNMVEVQHVDGSTTRYAHLSRINVAVGQKIEAGTLIGYSGGKPGAPGSGNSTGDHLHYEYLPPGGGPSDPAIGNNDDKFFRFGGNVQIKSKVQSQTGVMGQTGGKFAVVATGTNTYGDPEKVKSDTLQIINDLRRKGYTPIIVPPNESAYAAAHKASVEAAKQGGAQVEKGTYSSSDPLHLTMDSAKAIREKYKGAEFIGDSNAVRIAGSDLQGRRTVGSQTSAAVQYARNLPDIISTPQQVVPQSQVQSVPQQTTTPQQVQQYPSYAMVQQSVVLMPISQNQQAPVIVSGGGGSQTVVMPSPPQSAVLNNLMKTMLLTNLSGT